MKPIQAPCMCVHVPERDSLPAPHSRTHVRYHVLQWKQQLSKVTSNVCQQANERFIRFSQNWDNEVSCTVTSSFRVVLISFSVWLWEANTFVVVWDETNLDSYQPDELWFEIRATLMTHFVFCNIKAYLMILNEDMNLICSLLLQFQSGLSEWD